MYDNIRTLLEYYSLSEILEMSDIPEEDVLEELITLGYEFENIKEPLK